MKYLLPVLTVLTLCFGKTSAAEPVYFLTNGVVTAVSANDPPLPVTPVRTAAKRMVQVCENGVCRLVEAADTVVERVTYGPPARLAFSPSFTTTAVTASGCPCGCGMVDCNCGMTGSGGGAAYLTTRRPFQRLFHTFADWNAQRPKLAFVRR